MSQDNSRCQSCGKVNWVVAKGTPVIEECRVCGLKREAPWAEPVRMVPPVCTALIVWPGS